MQAHTAVAATAGGARWTGWQSSESRGYNWNRKKYLRAVQHAVGNWPPPGAQRVVEQSAMCRSCGENQPGAFCILFMCRPCCDYQRGDRHCPQHDN
eukprot:9104991-Pyramimonas_sp.AAC.2